MVRRRLTRSVAAPNCYRKVDGGKSATGLAVIPFQVDSGFSRDELSQI
jgi:hypothetical protein